MQGEGEFTFAAGERYPGTVPHSDSPYRVTGEPAEQIRHLLVTDLQLRCLPRILAGDCEFWSVQ